MLTRPNFDPSDPPGVIITWLQKHIFGRPGQDGDMDIKLNIESDPVSQAKSEKHLVVQVDAPVSEVFSTLQLHGAGSVLVCEGNKLTGIFTERDALKLMAAGADLSIGVGKVMSTDPVTIRHDAPIAEAIKLMASGGYRRLPLVDDNGELIGVVKVSGILLYLVDHFPETVFNLPPEPNTIMPEREGA